MILRWLETLNNYNFVVQFRNGKKHGNAATLSRCGHGGEPSELDEYERKEAIYHIRPKMSIRNNISELGDLIIANIMYPEQMMRAEIRQAQITDADTSKVRMWLESGKKPDRKDIRNESVELRQYLSIYETLFLNKDNLLSRRALQNEFCERDRLCLPPKLQEKASRACHELTEGHVGMHNTQYRILKRFYFLGLYKAVEML